MHELPTELQRPHFVTGRLAAPALQDLLRELMPQIGCEHYTVDVLPITVAALMTLDWIEKHVQCDAESSCVIIPGYSAPASGDLAPLAGRLGIPVIAGPCDMRRLPEFFGQQMATKPDGYGEYDIEIIAEINFAPRMTLGDIIFTATKYRQAGADIIDVGCDPSQLWPAIGECVTALVDHGFRVSVDSMNSREIAMAARAGAELVLSVNASNREGAADWGCEVVVIPDEPGTLAGLDASIRWLEQHQVAFRIDPILEPIGFGFADSLRRYLEVRQRYPACEIMMGIGNLTELTDCDSAGINALLIGLCQELGIRSVLTTEVINWARTSVQECDHARRLMHYAVTKRQLPKNVDPNLIMLRDRRLDAQGVEFFQQLAADIRDPNYRLFAESTKIHAVTRQCYQAEHDPFLLFEQLLAANPRGIDASHAFYLGYEMCKAATALTLGKQYRQDESLDWGMLTVPETSHRLRRTAKARDVESQ